MKRNTPVLLTLLLAIVLVAPLIITGCSSGAVTITQTTTTTAQGTTVTETAPATTITETAPAATITLPASTSTMTTTMTETQPPETVTATATTTITITPAIENQVIGMFNCQEAYDFIQANAGNPKLVVVDVRNPEAYDEAHIEGAINLPYNAGIEMQIKSRDRCGTYLIVCSTGRRSGETVDIMKTRGFYEVYNIGDGMTAWLASGLPIVQ